MAIAGLIAMAAKALPVALSVLDAVKGSGKTSEGVDGAAGQGNSLFQPKSGGGVASMLDPAKSVRGMDYGKAIQEMMRKGVA